MRGRAPASSANLGPGFDALAVALGLWVEVEVRPADRFSITSLGEGAELPTGEDHLAARVVRQVRGAGPVAIRVDSQIPVGRGLGSSAALAVAAAAAAGADRQAAFELATEVDGHPENAAASVFGGLVGAALIGGRPVAEPLALDPAIGFVVLVPERHLPTAEARRALPQQIPHADAGFNLGRMALLLSGLADHRRLRSEATEDRLHQQPRSGLFPEAAPLMEGLVRSGALAACWSGAGPTVLAITTQDVAAELRQAGERLLADHGLAGRALVLGADRVGMVVEPD